jgi:hypothetical protein
MKDTLAFIRLPLLLVVLFFVGRLVMSAMGVSYDAANRVFSMVILQVHLALIWGALGRSVQKYKLFGAVKAVVLIVLVSQVLIWIGTALSYAAGIDTVFNYPEALNSTAPVEFGQAMIARAGGLVANCIVGGVVGAIGWSLGSLAPGGRKG